VNWIAPPFWIFSRLFIPTVNVAGVALGVIAVPIGAAPTGAGLVVDVVAGVVLVAVVATPGADIVSDGGMAGILAAVLPTAVLVVAGADAVAGVLLVALVAAPESAIVNDVGMAGILAGSLPTAVFVAAGVFVAVIAGVAGLTAGVVVIAVEVAGVLPIAGLLAARVRLSAGGAVIESVDGIARIAGGVAGVLLVADKVGIAGGLTPIVGTAAGETVGRLSVIGGVGNLLGATVVGLRLPVVADKEIGLAVAATATPALGDELSIVLALAAVFTPVGDPPAWAIELSVMVVTVLGAVLTTWVVVLLLAVVVPSELVFST
jgi:hypothetical protein